MNAATRSDVSGWLRFKIAGWYWQTFVYRDRCLCRLGLRGVCGRIEEWLFYGN